MDSDETQFIALRAIIDAITDTSNEYILSAMKQLLDSEVIASRVKKGIMPYLYAAGLLSFAGREITRESLSSLVVLTGVTPDEELISTLLGTGIRTHLVYTYAFYYLLASSAGTSVENMIKVVKSLGIEPDEQAANEMRELCLKIMNE